MMERNQEKMMLKKQTKGPHSLPVQKLPCSRGQGSVRGVHNRVDALTVCICQHPFHVPAGRKAERAGGYGCCPLAQLRLETRQSQQGLTHKELANRRMGDRGIWRVRKDGKFPPWSSCNLGMTSVFQPVHRQESTYNGWKERNSGRA